MKKALILIPLLLTGCATVFGPSKDTISINSPDSATKILVDGEYAGTGNVRYPVPRGKTVTITALKAGCAPQVVMTDKSMTGLAWLNIFFWPGFIVDAVTGSIQKADPTTYTVDPVCKLADHTRMGEKVSVK